MEGGDGFSVRVMYLSNSEADIKVTGEIESFGPVEVFHLNESGDRKISTKIEYSVFIALLVLTSIVDLTPAIIEIAGIRKKSPNSFLVKISNNFYFLAQIVATLLIWFVLGMPGLEFTPIYLG